MFQYAAARTLSLRNSRELFIDAFSGFDSDNFLRQYALGDFAISARLLTRDEAKHVSSRTQIRTRILREFENVCKNSLGVGYIGRVLTGCTAGHFFLDGYWQSERYFADAAETIASDFACEQMPSDSGKRILDEIKAATSVSIHVRRKDYPVRCSRQYYRAACERVMSRIPGATFFLFGDDPEWMESLAANLNSQMECVIVPGQVRDLDEFEMMRACKHHIIANSTFSWWAAWLSEHAHKESLIIAPATGWSSKRDFIRDVVPSRWITLSHEGAQDSDG